MTPIFLSGADPAAIIRASLASNRVIVIPPGTYNLLSRMIPNSPVTYQSGTCILFAGLTNCHVFAYGCTFLVDNSISGPMASHLNSGTSHYGFQGNCRDCGFYGGAFIGNRTGLNGTTLNNGGWFESATNLTLRDQTFKGDFSVGSALNSLIENIRMIGPALGVDIGWCEDVTFRGIRCFASGNPVPTAGFKLASDGPTQTDDVVTTEAGASRALRGGISNGIDVLDSEFVGYLTGVFMGDVNGGKVSRCTIRDGVSTTQANCAGVSIVTTGATGPVAQNVTVEGCDIFNNGAAGTGGGVLLATSGNGLTSITVRGNRIYDNANGGVVPSGIANLGSVVIESNDFASRSSAATQTTAVSAALLAAISAAGSVRINRGLNPTREASNRALPTASGAGQTAINALPFSCEVICSNTDATVIFPRIVRVGQITGDPLFPGGIANGAAATFTLDPGEGVYFDQTAAAGTALPSGLAWVWKGLAV